MATIEEAKREAIKAIERLAVPKCPAREYLEACEEVSEYVEAMIEAARDDVRRAEADE